MNELPIVSVVITNYDYGLFLGSAIDSALGQTYPNVEVVVVDDGSTDSSREIISGYANRVVAILKPNEGQTEAINCGFFHSRGQIVCFLDSDDMLLPDALRNAVDLFSKGGFSQVHWPLALVDKDGCPTGDVIPRARLLAGDLSDLIIQQGPFSSPVTPTSANAWDRGFLDRVFPIVPLEDRTGTDVYLNMLAPLFGHVGLILEPQSYYRMHAHQHSRSYGIDREARFFRTFEAYSGVLARYLRGLGVYVDPKLWKQRNPRFRRMQQRAASHEELASIIPPGESYILVDQNEWYPGELLPGRHRLSISILDRTAELYAPDDDQVARQEVLQLRMNGAAFIVFLWPAFWRFDQDGGLTQWLSSAFPCVLDNVHLRVFDLRSDLAGGRFNKKGCCESLFA